MTDPICPLCPTTDTTMRLTSSWACRQFDNSKRVKAMSAGAARIA